MAISSTPSGSSGEGEEEGKREEILEQYEIVGTDGEFEAENEGMTGLTTGQMQQSEINCEQSPSDF